MNRWRLKMYTESSWNWSLGRKTRAILVLISALQTILWGQTEHSVSLHRKLIRHKLCFTQHTYLFTNIIFITDRAKSNDARNFVLANQVDSTEILNNGIMPHVFHHQTNCLWTHICHFSFQIHGILSIIHRVVFWCRQLQYIDRQVSLRSFQFFTITCHDCIF